MQLTYNNLPVDSLNEDFQETIKTHFSGKNVSIVILDGDSTKLETQMDMFHKMEDLRKRLSKVKVESSIDLSDLANEVNLSSHDSHNNSRNK